MSRRTLPDELRSVLLSHSLDAPEPDQTVQRILAGTVSLPDDEVTERRRWRPSVGVVGAVACVALVVAGVSLVRGFRHSDSNNAAGGSAAMSIQSGTDAQTGGGTRPGLTAPSRHSGPMNANGAESVPTAVGLDCSATLPGSALVAGARTSFQATATEVVAYEFFCLGDNGRHSGSQVEAFQPIGGQLHYLSTLVKAAENVHLLELAPATRGVTVTGTDKAGALVALTFDTHDDGLTFGRSTGFVADTCQAATLAARVSKVEQVSAANGQLTPGHSVLLLTNRGSASCVLEGYPTLTGARDGKAVGPVLRQTLRGPAGGLRSSVPPIVQLTPGATAGAIIEAGTALPSCVPAAQLKVTLANGVSLGVLPAALTGCEQVHPFVNNPSGSG